MGFHVCIDVSGLCTRQLIKICQNFIMYEDVTDSFMPPSRRTGSRETDRYFKSNRQSVGSNMTSKQRKDALLNCRDVSSLARIMNAGGSRYFKMNLQNLVTGRQPTIEFRQHSATSECEKVNAWIRFCSAFVHNSTRLQPSRAFRSNCALDEQFEALFYHVIKDRDFYAKRRRTLNNEEDAC